MRNWIIISFLYRTILVLYKDIVQMCDDVCNGITMMKIRYPADYIGYYNIDNPHYVAMLREDLLYYHRPRAFDTANAVRDDLRVIDKKLNELELLVCIFNWYMKLIPGKPVDTSTDKKRMLFLPKIVDELMELDECVNNRLERLKRYRSGDGEKFTSSKSYRNGGRKHKKYNIDRTSVRDFQHIQ